MADTTADMRRAPAGPAGRPEGSARIPRAGRWAKGYHTGEVDGFLAQAETSLTAAGAGLGAPMPPEDIRRVGFTLVRGGYDITHVDGLLDRLEERALVVQHRLDGAPESPAGLADALRAQLGTAPGAHFRRTGLLRLGYDVDAVDDVVERVAVTLDRLEGRAGGRHAAGIGATGPLDIDAVRTVVFREQLRGYDEDEVDAFLDQVIELLLRFGASAQPAH